MSLEDERREAFRAWMTKRGLTAAEVARATSTSPSTLYSYLRGQSKNLGGSLQDRIAAAFNTSVNAMFGRQGERSTIGVYGKIGVRAEVYPSGDFDIEPKYDLELPPGLDPDEDYMAFQIAGFSMPPATDGWIVIVRKRQVPVDELINNVCVIDLDDGRRLFKRLRRGYTRSLYNLESWDGSPLIEDVRVVHAFPLRALIPGRSAP